MKKLLALILALCLAFGMVSAFAEEDVTGTWYLVDMGGVNPGTMGVSITMELTADGTITIIISQGEASETQTGTWKLEGAQIIGTIDDVDETFDIVDGQLATDMGGMIGTFGRELPEEEPAPVIIPAESEEAFLGTWTVSKIGMDDMIIPYSALSALFGDVDLTYVIEPGRVLASSTTESDGTPVEYTTEFADGKLTASRPNEFAELTGVDTVTYEWQLTDQGYLVYMEEFGESLMAMYLEKVEE